MKLRICLFYSNRSCQASREERRATMPRKSSSGRLVNGSPVARFLVHMTSLEACNPMMPILCGSVCLLLRWKN